MGSGGGGYAGGSVGAAGRAVRSSLGLAPHSSGVAALAAEPVAIAVPDDLVLHVAMEYAIPHLGMNTQFMYGGLGKVRVRHAPPVCQG
jgi:hypothetical protein